MAQSPLMSIIHTVDSILNFNGGNSEHGLKTLRIKILSEENGK